MCLFEVTWFYLEVEETLHIADELIPTFLFLHSLTQQEQSKKPTYKAPNFTFPIYPHKKKPLEKYTKSRYTKKKEKCETIVIEGKPSMMSL